MERQNVLLKNSIVFILFLSMNAFANKLSFGLGAYSLNAKVGAQTTSLSNLGSYKFSYRSPILSNFELNIGYSVVIENIVSGDKSFGPVLGMNYFPYGSQTVSSSSLGSFSLMKIKNYNPYITAAFTQRQFQSIRTSYSGFTFGGGVEVGLTKTISMFSEGTWSSLQGPNSGTATEITAIAGLVYNYL